MRHGPIIPANLMTVQQAASAVPQMGQTLQAWMKPITLGLVRKVERDHQIFEVVDVVESAGVIQPLSARQLMLKSEGERDWAWFMLHCTASLLLANDDQVIYKNTRYRVMKQWPFEDYGFRQYDLVADYITQQQLPGPGSRPAGPPL